MIEMVDVIEVRALDDHRLWLRFSDLSEGSYDFSDLLKHGGPVTEPLRDAEMFKRVFISNGVPTWPSGYDVDAINLHREMRDAGLLQKTAA